MTGSRAQPDGNRVVRAVLVAGLALIAVANFLLFAWLNGDGFVQSRDGYWSLRTEAQGDFRYVVENQPHPEMAGTRFYLRLGQFAQGHRVTFAPGTLDPISVRALTRAEPVVDSSLPTELDPTVVEGLDDVLTGAFFEGPDYLIVPPSSPATTDYRLIRLGEVLVLMPEMSLDLLEPGGAGS